MIKFVFVVVLTGPLKGHKYFIKSDSEILIGRTGKANIRIAYDDFCSRKHALLYWKGHTCFIEDLSSKNGTFINSKRISEKKELKDRDIIGLGDTKLLVSVKNVNKGNKTLLEDDVFYED